jgi:Pyruvate phosphate dikinase, AMP/ATP-binding domain
LHGLRTTEQHLAQLSSIGQRDKLVGGNVQDNVHLLILKGGGFRSYFGSWFASLVLIDSRGLKAQSFRLDLLQNSDGNFFNRLFVVVDSQRIPARRIIDSASLTSMRQFFIDAYLELGRRSVRISLRRSGCTVSPNIWDLCGTLFDPTDPVVPFELLRMSDVDTVGGKNARLGEMILQLPTGVKVPTGFATTTHRFREFLKHENLARRISPNISRY